MTRSPASAVTVGALDQRLPLWGLLSTWAVTRVLMLMVWGLFEQVATGDVLYYHRRIGELAEAGLAATLVEYPTPVVGILSLPWLAGAGTVSGYLAGFIVMMLALDGWLTWALHRSSPRPAAVLFWLAFVPLLGPLTLLRFDMIPAVLAGIALLISIRRPAVAGGLIGLGAAVKLWPALLLPALLGRAGHRERTVAGFLGVGLGLALLSLLVGGPQRLFSPLGWQGERGLQVESIWATPVMLWHLVSPELHSISMSPYQAFEIFGPQVGLWTAVSTAATALGLVVMAVLFVRTWRAGSPTVLGAAALMTAVVAIMIITNKTLSPQYVLWLGGPVAVLVQQVSSRPAQTSGWPARWVRLTALTTLGLAVLTHLVYPLMYSFIVYDPPGLPQTSAVLVMAVRNLGLVALTVLAVALSWRLSAASRDDGPGSRQAAASS